MALNRNDWHYIRKAPYQSYRWRIGSIATPQCGFLPPKSTVRLCGPTARYKIAAELLMCIDHDSNISCTC
ncbi:hypothetical protein ALC56_09587 [Trachymyrmex septentrionalis]|uniref:Uncharacterized protein n=1 Tax=Trachymyrmex septentrionalis TaxID=34720 RepID=A0A195F633_9HYME|nr:hypothetical protein ALC56_09587 [Trachymyrmex septentrionalis]